MANQIFGQESVSGHNYMAVNSDGSINIRAVASPELQADIDYLSGAIDGNSDDIQYLSGRIDALSGGGGSTDVTYLSAVIDSNTSSITYLSGQININTGSITYLSGAIDQNTLDILGIGSDLTYLSGAIDLNATNISSNDDDIDYLSGAIDQNTSDISSNDDDIDYLSGAIDQNTSDITDNDADIVYLSGEVDFMLDRRTGGTVSGDTYIEGNTQLSGTLQMVGRDTDFSILFPDVRIYNKTGGQLIIDNYTDDIFKLDDGGELSLLTGTGINEFSTDGTLAGNSDDAVPTEKAVKTYVDAQAGGAVSGVYDISYQTGQSDSTTAWADVGNNMSVTVPEDGKYKIQAVAHIRIVPSANTTSYYASIRLHDGSAQVGTSVSQAQTQWGDYTGSNCTIPTTITEVADLTKDDVIALQIRASHTSFKAYATYNATWNIGSISITKIGD